MPVEVAVEGEEAEAEGGEAPRTNTTQEAHRTHRPTTRNGGSQEHPNSTTAKTKTSNQSMVWMDSNRVQ